MLKRGGILVVTTAMTRFIKRMECYVNTLNMFLGMHITNTLLY